MIIDKLGNARRYFALHPGLQPAFDFLANTDFSQLEEGRREIDGDRLYALLQRKEGVGKEAAKLEAHRRYLDIQVCLEGSDCLGWKALALCRDTSQGYNQEKDLEFFSSPAETYVDLLPQSFALLFPEDAHAPLSGNGKVFKAVVKVALDW